jgi:hypothetical protein
LTEERLAEVRFVPLIGEQGWADDKRGDIEIARVRSSTGDASLVRLVTETAEPITDLNSSCVEALVERIGDARLVLLGEATHGTSEFYRMRARITMELIAKRGFDFVAVEADWPDAARIDTYVLGEPPRSGLEFTPSAGSLPGCGATKRSTSLSDGSARTTFPARIAPSESDSTASTSTACSRRWLPFSNISAAWTRRRRVRLAPDTAR